MKRLIIVLFCVWMSLALVSAQDTETFNPDDRGYFVQDVTTVTVEDSGDGTYLLTFDSLPATVTSIVNSEDDVFTSSYPMDTFLQGFNNTDEPDLNLNVTARLQLADRVLAFALTTPQFDDPLTTISFVGTLDEDKSIFINEDDGGKIGKSVADNDIPGTYENVKLVYALNGDDLSQLGANILASMRLGSITNPCMTCGK